MTKRQIRSGRCNNHTKKSIKQRIFENQFFIQEPLTIKTFLPFLKQRLAKVLYYVEDKQETTEEEEEVVFSKEIDSHGM